MRFQKENKERRGEGKKDQDKSASLFSRAMRGGLGSSRGSAEVQFHYDQGLAGM
jgi:hypothetical protein